MKSLPFSIWEETAMEEFLQVGVISSTHGIRGEVKVFPTTDDAARFKKLKKVFLDTGKERLELEIQAVRFFKQFVIVKFKGIDNINEIERYKGKSLLVDRGNAVALEEDEYYIADLIGMEVVTEEGHFGILRDVMETGANEVYIIDSDSYGEVLVPAIRQCILDVDVENKRMKIRLMDGLLCQALEGEDKDEFPYTYIISGNGLKRPEYKHYRPGSERGALVDRGSEHPGLCVQQAPERG